SVCSSSTTSVRMRALASGPIDSSALTLPGSAPLPALFDASGVDMVSPPAPVLRRDRATLSRTCSRAGMTRKYADLRSAIGTRVGGFLHQPAPGCEAPCTDLRHAHPRPTARARYRTCCVGAA